MKKALALLFAVVMCVSLTACDAESLELYTLSNEAMADVTSMRAIYSMDMQTGNETSTAVATMEAVMRSETDMDLAMTMVTTDEIGQQITVSTYMKDGYMYMNAGGYKYKVPMIDQDVSMDLLEDFDPETFDDIIKSSSVTTYDDSYVISASVDATTINSLMQLMLNQMSPGVEMSFDNAYGSITMDKDYMITSMAMNFSTQIGYEDESVDATYKMHVRLTDLNGIEEVAFPFDLYQYEELDLGLIA